MKKKKKGKHNYFTLSVDIHTARASWIRNREMLKSNNGRSEAAERASKQAKVLAKTFPFKRVHGCVCVCVVSTIYLHSFPLLMMLYSSFFGLRANYFQIKIPVIAVYFIFFVHCSHKMFVFAFYSLFLCLWLWALGSALADVHQHLHFANCSRST